MEKDDCEPHSGAGQDCPAQKPFEAPTEITINGERLRIVQVTDEEGKAITQYLKERAESAPVGARIGRASALARSGLRVAAIILLAAGVGIGLGDGDLFDDVGCSVAQQPRRVSHDADSGQAGEHPDGKVPGSDGGSGNGSDDGGPAGRPECEVRAEMCVNRMPDGLCRMSNRQCRLIQLPIADFRLPIEKIIGRTADILQAILFQRDLLTGLIRGQEKLLAAEPRLGYQAIEPAPVPESVARQVFALVHELETDGRRLKAPIMRVFRLYCMDGLTAVKVARRCGCSKSLVLLRLKQLRTKLGRDPAELRQFSSHFEQIEASLSDPRAKRIYRKGALDGDAPDDATGDR
jgi:hypothetical protein